MSLVVDLVDEDALLAFAGRCAPLLAECQLVFLQGTLGAGKTTFARGMLRALGYEGSVKSPTYTLVEPYQFEEKAVNHFDLYRLADPEELEFMGIRDYLGTGNLCLVEWPDKAGGLLGEPDLVLEIQIVSEGRRLCLQAFSARGEAVLEGLRAG